MKRAIYVSMCLFVYAFWTIQCGTPPSTEREGTSEHNQDTSKEAGQTIERRAETTPEPPKPREQTKAEPKSEPKTEPKTEPRSEPQPEPRVEPKPEPTIEPPTEPLREPIHETVRETPQEPISDAMGPDAGTPDARETQPESVPESQGTDTPDAADTTPEQPPEVNTAAHLWAVSGGSKTDDSSNAIALDATGNVLIAGQLGNPGTFGTQMVTPTPGQQAFVAKVDPTGKWLWATTTDNGGQTGMSANINAMATDTQGNIYVTGRLYGDVAFGTTTLKATNATDIDIFVAKLDAKGKWLWAKRAGGPLTGSAGFEQGNDIALDTSGAPIITGYFAGNASFGALKLTSKGASDIFVAKLDATGKWLWAKRAGSTAADQGTGLAITSAGDIWLLSNANGNADFGTTQLNAVAAQYAVLARLNAQGQWQQAIQMRSTKAVSGTSLAINAKNEIAVSGQFNGIMTLGTTARTAKSSNDIFVAMLATAPQASWKWWQQAGIAKPQFDKTNNAYDVAFDTAGDLYATGRYNQRIQFGPSLIKTTDLRFWRAFLAKISKSGQWLWGRGIDSLAVETTGLLLDATDNIYVTGKFGFAATFGTTNLTPRVNRKYDAFVWKLK